MEPRPSYIEPRCALTVGDGVHAAGGLNAPNLSPVLIHLTAIRHAPGTTPHRTARLACWHSLGNYLVVIDAHDCFVGIAPQAADLLSLKNGAVHFFAHEVWVSLDQGVMALTTTQLPAVVTRPALHLQVIEFTRSLQRSGSQLHFIITTKMTKYHMLPYLLLFLLVFSTLQTAFSNREKKKCCDWDG